MEGNHDVCAARACRPEGGKLLFEKKLAITQDLGWAGVLQTLQGRPSTTQVSSPFFSQFSQITAGRPCHSLLEYKKGNRDLQVNLRE